MFFASYVLKARRFQMLIDNEAVRFWPLLGVTSVHGMLNYMLPARTGEFSYLLLTRRELGLSLSEGTATLVTARLGDFVVISLFLPFVVIAFLEELPRWLVYASWAFCVGVYLTAGISWWFFRRPPDAVKKSCAGSTSLSDRAGRMWHDMRWATHRIYSRGRYGAWIVLSILIWSCIYAYFFLIVRSLGFGVSFSEIVVTCMLVVPATLLPVRGVANIGTHEIAWVIAFGLFGYPPEVGLSIAVSSHLLIVFFVLCTGAVGLALISQWSARERRLERRRLDV